VHAELDELPDLSPVDDDPQPESAEPVAEGWYRMVMYSDSSPVSTIHEFELINLTNILDLEFL